MGKLLDVVRNLRNQLNYHKEMVTVHSSERRELMGLSTDTKPEGMSENMLFLESQ